MEIKSKIKNVVKKVEILIPKINWFKGFVLPKKGNAERGIFIIKRYLVDKGQRIGKKNGFEYGWSKDMSKAIRCNSIITKDQNLDCNAMYNLFI